MGATVHQFSASPAPATPPPGPAPQPAPPTAGDDTPASDFDPFEDYRQRGGMRCPHCRAIAKRRSSVEVTPLFWDIYYVCSHPGCGHTWKANLSYAYGLSPSAVPNPDHADLPIKPMARDDVVKPELPPPDDPRQSRLFD